MACYRPLSAHQDRERLLPPRLGGYWAGEQGYKLELPCGRCVGCLQSRAQSWKLRCTHEAMCHDHNLFLTLDYSPEKLKSWSLQYRDFQLFMKRLRHVNGPTRYYVAGEYGERFRRPHFHALLFGCDFPDRQLLHNGTYRSTIAERVWNNGHVVIGRVSPASAAYVAGYTLDKKYGLAAEAYEDLVDPTTGEVSSRRPPFCAMSRRPGVGSKWFERFRGDLFPHDFAVDGDGRRQRVPRYYWNKFKEVGDADLVEEIEHKRFLRAKEMPIEESTEARRRVREEVDLARIHHFQREH